MRSLSTGEAGIRARLRLRTLTFMVHSLGITCSTMCTLSSNVTRLLCVVAGQATCQFGRKAVISHKITQLTSTRAQRGFKCAAPAHARNCSPRVCHELVELERDRLESLLLLRFLLFFFFLLLLLLLSWLSAGAEGFSCKYRQLLP